MKLFASSSARREAKWGYAFISPWVLGLVIFTAFPIIASLLLTFFSAQLTGDSRNFTFVGLDNWARFFGDEKAWSALGVTLRFMLLSLPVGLFIPLMVAILLNSKALIAPGLFRVLWFLPYVIPFVAGVVAWRGVLGQDGPVNGVLHLLGVENPPFWLNDIGWIYPALVLMGIWGIGSAIIVYLAGLGGVPTELYEAATVDGAGWWSSFRHITLPMITPVIFYNLVLGIAGSLQYFLVPFVINGGNGTPGGSTLFFNILQYKTFFSYQDPGYGSVLAWVLFIVTLFFSLVLFGTQRRWVYYAGETK